MSQPEIERTNARLANPPEVDVEVSRRMGLYVVATLARRHYIDVRLHSAEMGGLVATVLVPVELVTEPIPPAELPALLVDQEPDEAPIAGLPPLDSPLFPLYVPEEDSEPEPEPEPLPPPAPAPDEWPLRRAPVVEREPAPVWPTEDDDPSLRDSDEPTERLPAYQDVLSKWFATGPPSRPAITPYEPVVDQQAFARPEAEPEPRWPTEDEPEYEDDAQSLPRRVPRARVAEETQYHWPPEERPILSLSPDEVRERMSSLQGGVRRGRHARGDGSSTN
jgi:hypothetical protein